MSTSVTIWDVRVLVYVPTIFINCFCVRCCLPSLLELSQNIDAFFAPSSLVVALARNHPMPVVQVTLHPQKEDVEGYHLPTLEEAPSNP